MSDFKNYLKQINLGKFGEFDDRELNDIVEESKSISVSNLSDEEIENLYKFDVPELSPDGSCSISNSKSNIQYNLAETYGLEWDLKTLKDAKSTKRLVKLKYIIQDLQKLTEVDWLGIYRKIDRNVGNSYMNSLLLKESYYGAISRPEFPLTEEFAQKSNNSTVGLSGKAVLISDVATHTGAYYICDGKVLSEFCCPIINENGEIIGIIDAESFKTGFFDETKVREIAKVCFDLGREGLFV